MFGIFDWLRWLQSLSKHEPINIYIMFHRFSAISLSSNPASLDIVLKCKCETFFNKRATHQITNIQNLQVGLALEEKHATLIYKPSAEKAQRVFVYPADDKMPH